MAAAKKDPSAEYNLGICYERGLGIEKDMSKAASLYKSAADHGHTGAQYNLGVFYEHGLGGFAVDKKEAARFYRMATEAGDEDALHNLLLLRKQMETEKLARQSVKPQNLVFSLLREMVLPGGRHGHLSHENKSIPRCASSPGILDESAESDQQNASSNKPPNALLAFWPFGSHVDSPYRFETIRSQIPDVLIQFSYKTLREFCNYCLYLALWLADERARFSCNDRALWKFFLP